MGPELYTFDLPPQLIATAPRIEGARARLLVLDRAAGAIHHRRVGDLPEILGSRYHLVANDSAVLPSTVQVEGEGGSIPVALGRDHRDGRWRPVGRAEEVVDPFSRYSADGLPEDASRWGALGDAEAVRRLSEEGQITFPRYLAHLKELYPRGIPPFYRSPWAAHPGSVAPPSGGLNLTGEVLRGIHAAGSSFSTLTVHIGHVTFRRPVVSDLDAHRMEGEPYELSPEGAQAILRARAAGRRLLAVGTSATRALEHLSLEGGIPAEGARDVADLFIRPGFRFAAADALFTGLHGPGTTLFMLVCAFGGRDAVMESYRQAVARGYRWYTLGDSMLIL